MKRILNIFKKVTKNEDKREWYTAEMETVNGVKYNSGVRAGSPEEASEMILQDAYKGNKILSIRKGM